MPRTNKAMLINSLCRGGAERCISTVLNNSSEKILLILLYPQMSYKITNPNVHIMTLSNRKTFGSDSRSFFYMILFIFKLKRIIKTFKINTVQSHLFYSNYINIICKLLGSKHQVQIGNRVTLLCYKKKKLSAKIKLYLIKTLYPFADKIINVSKGVHDDCIKIVPKTSKKSMVINNPYNIEEILKKAKLPTESFEIKKDKNVILNVGRLVPSKRQKDLILAVKQLTTTFPDIQLLIIGEGTEKEHLQALINKLELNNIVHLLGDIENPYAYYNRADIFVCSSEAEGFPNALVEAMICGCAIISSNCNHGPKEILEDNKYGLLYEVGDISDLTEKLQTFLSDKNVRKLFSEKSIEKSAQYSHEKIIKKYIQTLNRNV